MKGHTIILFALLASLSAGCSNLRGAKLLLPESFGFRQISKNLYLENAADPEAEARLLEAMDQAEDRIRICFGDVKSNPVVHVCVSDDCYRSFGGMGSKAKVYGDHILLSPRGFTWHYLAHEWSHDEIRTRLSFWAWWRLPRWFDEGLAVVISEAPEHSEAHWQSLVVSGVERPSRSELLGYRSLRQWLDAVRRYGETQNSRRRAEGAPEVRPVYAAAGHEVRPWFAEVGTPGLLDMIRRLNQGEGFEKIYSENSKADSTGKVFDGVRTGG